MKFNMGIEDWRNRRRPGLIPLPNTHLQSEAAIAKFQKPLNNSWTNDNIPYLIVYYLFSLYVLNVFSSSAKLG